MINTKKSFLYLAIIGVTCFGACKKPAEQIALESKSEIQLEWNDVHQQIDGFGTFAGRIEPLYEAGKRDSIMAYLLGDEGLRFTILRGKVLRTYPFNENTGEVTIWPKGITKDMNKATYDGLDAKEKEQVAQYWILKTAKEKYRVPFIFASAWTPPLNMKRDTLKESAEGFNSLNWNTSSTKYANYLSGFINAFKVEGVDFKAISPANEPENIVAQWDASFWEPRQVGEFAVNNLRPALNKAGLNSVKIMGPENAGWNSTKLYLNLMNRNGLDMYAGHGYAEITDHLLDKLQNTPGRLSGLNQSPFKWNFNTEGKSVWMTEASDDAGTGEGKKDGSMRGGIRLAVSMHKFLAECDVNAYVWWLGMLAFEDNEALIWYRGDNNTLNFPKMYDVMGHYSRFIRPGFQRIGIKSINELGLLTSAYRDPQSGKFVLVVTNPTDKEIPLNIDFADFSTNEMSLYQTTDSSVGHWPLVDQLKPRDGKKYFDVVMPAKSISTLLGKKND